MKASHFARFLHSFNDNEIRSGQRVKDKD